MTYDTTKPYSDKILKLISATWKTERCRVYADEEHPYPVMYLSGEAFVDHTDGIGTKGYYHWRKRTFKNAAIDVMAMNVNDLLMINATPIKMQNHIFLPKDDHEAILEIVEGLVEICKEHDIAITGGETSIHMNMNGMDISGCVTGMFHSSTNRYQIGDILIGFPSSGLHSNGFTMVHDVMGGFRDEYVMPTRIYWELFQVRKFAHAANHITGGAFTKLRPYLPAKSKAVIKFPEEPQQIFKDLFKGGISSDVMYKTFNCGYGFVMGVPEERVGEILAETDGKIIGEIRKLGQDENQTVWIESAFDGKMVSY